MQGLMQQGLSADILANEICMRRTQYAGSFLVVEGATDVRFFQNLTNEKDCNIVDALGKERAVATVEVIDQRKVTGVVAIVDADFERLDTIPDKSSNILLTDTHDLETMMLQSPALEKLLAEFGSIEKLTTLAEDIRMLLIRGATLLGFLRFISHRDKLNLRFKELSFERFVDKNTLGLDIVEMAKTVKNHSQKPGINIGDITSQIENLRDQPHDPWQVSCGHDVISILSIGLRKLIGTQQPNEVKPELLEMCLRLSYDRGFFATTKLFEHLREWEYRSPGYRVLAENTN